MAAKIIPFPRFMQRHFILSHGRHAADALQETHEWNTADGIHLVGTAAPQAPGVNAEVSRESQQEALRIVQEVQQEWNDSHRSVRVAQDAGGRSQRFWATLPLPRPQRETPLTVARRLMHMFLSDARTA